MTMDQPVRHSCVAVNEHVDVDVGFERKLLGECAKEMMVKWQERIGE